jgi:Kef-type K+ transport system membrane component KefB
LLWTTDSVSASALRDPVFLRDAIILGTAGAMTATSSAEVFRVDDRAGALQKVLQLEELAAIIGLAIIAAYFRPRHEVTWQLPGTAWLLLTLGLGATLGLISLLIMRRPKEGPELLVLTLGMIAFSAGTAGYLGLSPVVLAFLAGAWLALLPPLHKRWIAEALRRLERPIYLLSLVVIGALWRVDDWRSWLLVPVFTIARLAGKRVGVELGLRHNALDLSSEQKQALSIAPIGPLAIAIVVNAQLLYPGGSISPIVAAVIVGGIVTEIIVQLVSRRGSVKPPAAAELRV